MSFFKTEKLTDFVTSSPEVLEIQDENLCIQKRMKSTGNRDVDKFKRFFHY